MRSGLETGEADFNVIWGPYGSFHGSCAGTCAQLYSLLGCISVAAVVISESGHRCSTTVRLKA